MRDLKIPRFKYTFKVFRKFPEENIPEDIRWVCYALDIVHPRDKDETVIQIFIELLEAVQKERGVTTQEIATKMGITRGTVLHHMKRLAHRGLVVRKGSIYELREHSLSYSIDRIVEDVNRYVNDILHVSEAIDRFYGLQARR